MPPFPFIMSSKSSGLQEGWERSGDDLNTFKGLSLTASVLLVRRLQGCCPL